MTAIVDIKRTNKKGVMLHKKTKREKIKGNTGITKIHSIPYCIVVGIRTASKGILVKGLFDKLLNNDFLAGSSFLEDLKAISPFLGIYSFLAISIYPSVLYINLAQLVKLANHSDKFLVAGSNLAWVACVIDGNTNHFATIT